MQLGTVQKSRRPKGHVITHFTRAQHPPAQSRRKSLLHQTLDYTITSDYKLFIQRIFLFFTAALQQMVPEILFSSYCLAKNQPITTHDLSPGMRTGLNIPSSSSSSSVWHVCTPRTPPDSGSSPGPLPPFSKPQELVLCRLLEVDPGPASLSACFFLWMSLCLCKTTHVLARSSLTACLRLHRIPYLTDDHASCHGQPGPGGEVRRDHDAHAGLWEGQLVGVEDEKLIHHHNRRRLLTCEHHLRSFYSERNQSSEVVSPPSWPLLRRTMEVLQAEASSRILSSLWSSDPEQHGFTLLNWRVTNTRSWELNLQPLAYCLLIRLFTSNCVCPAERCCKPTSWWRCRIHTWSWGAATPTWTTQQYTQKTH